MIADGKITSVLPHEASMQDGPPKGTPSLQRMCTTESTARRSCFDLRPSDLVNNDASKILEKERRSVNVDNVMFSALQAVDGLPSKPKNVQFLKDGVKLIRILFWAFEDVETQEDDDEVQIVRSEQITLRRRATKIVQHEAFSLFFMVLTFYALFGPDLLMSFGHTPRNPRNHILAIFNTFVLALFVIEEALQCWVYPGYLCSMRFWIDTVATISIIGDSYIAFEFFKSDAMAAGRGSRLLRLVRIGGRSGRLVRLARLTQILRILPRVQKWMEKSTEELALLLWHKRMWHLFQYFDIQGKGELTEESEAYLNTSMDLVFPDMKGARLKSQSQGLKEVENNVLAKADKIMEGFRRAISNIQHDHQTDVVDTSFKGFVTKYILTPIGKRSYQRCIEDIQCMKESCAIVEKSIARMTLKVCVMVLSLLVMMSVLEVHQDDISVMQGLKQFDLMARDPEVSYDVICSLVKDTYSKQVSSQSLQLLILQNQLYWDSTCQCCSTVAQWVADVEERWVNEVDSSPREPHEMLVSLLSNGTNQDEGEPTTAAVFDTHESSREAGVLSFIHTFVVVLLLMSLVLFFASDMKKLSNKNVLHPLWVLMDDMCALKSIEVLCQGTQQDSDIIPVLYNLSMQNKKAAACVIRCRLSRRIPVADELVQLRSAFTKLHQAMCSWSKYVPMVLLKQLLEAGVEARIGCTPCQVSVLFCDVANFQDMAQGMHPKDVLEILGVVLNGVHDAIVDNGGTLLEFIGDEVLAVFNAPQKVTNHSFAAVHAALQAISYASKLPNGHGVRLQCSVHSAQVLCGNIGSPTRMKYGLLGDGVNLTARLKSLNTRYGTQLLVSEDAMKTNQISSSLLSFGSDKEEVAGAQAGSSSIVKAEPHEDDLVTRIIGHLVLKGRTTPTTTVEVIGTYSSLPQRKVKGFALYTKAFSAYTGRSFRQARDLFQEAYDLLSRNADGEVVSDDRPTKHHIELCDQYIDSPPPEGWDGSEVLKKKAWH